MSFRQWVSDFVKRKDAKTHETLDLPDHVDTLESEANGLNFHTAIQAHHQWKLRLQAVIDKESSAELSVDVVSRDDQCVLGKWIHGIGGERFGRSAIFLRLQKNHAKFHTCAGKVLALAQAGKKEEAQVKLKSNDYAQVSQNVIYDLAHMYSHMDEKSD